MTTGRRQRTQRGSHSIERSSADDFSAPLGAAGYFLTAHDDVAESAPLKAQERIVPTAICKLLKVGCDARLGQYFYEGLVKVLVVMRMAKSRVSRRDEAVGQFLVVDDCASSGIPAYDITSLAWRVLLSFCPGLEITQ